MPERLKNFVLSLRDLKRERDISELGLLNPKSSLLSDQSQTNLNKMPSRDIIRYSNILKLQVVGQQLHLILKMKCNKSNPFK